MPKYGYNAQPKYSAVPVLALTKGENGRIYSVGLYPDTDVIHYDRKEGRGDSVIESGINLQEESNPLGQHPWYRRQTKLREFSEDDITDFCRFYELPRDEIEELVALARQYDTR